MNAIIREKYTSVLTNEAIEVHLSYLRSGFDTMQAVLHALSSKIDKANEERAKGDAALSAKLETVESTLNAKMDKLNEKVLTIEGRHNTMLFVVGLAAIIGSAVSIAKNLDWV